MKPLLRASGAIAIAALLAACSGPNSLPSSGELSARTPSVEAGFSGSSMPRYPRIGSSETTAPVGYASRRATALHEGPRDGFSVIAVLPANTPVTTTGYVADDGWWQVDSKYGTGWVYSRDLHHS